MFLRTTSASPFHPVPLDGNMPSKIIASISLVFVCLRGLLKKKTCRLKCRAVQTEGKVRAKLKER